MESLRRSVEEAEEANEQLRNELEEERKKTEDFLFQVEEGEIIKDDLEVKICPKNTISYVTVLN